MVARNGNVARIFFTFAFIGIGVSLASSSSSLKNVVHIISDDLRPELGAYGAPFAHTPNIDSIAKGGTVFDRAYANQAVCGPSRNSIYSGRRPDRSRTWNFINHFREDHPEWTSLPGLFLKHDEFVSIAAGKTYHPNQPPLYDGDKSWSEMALPYYNPCWNTADNSNASFKDGGLPCLPCPIDLEHYILKKKISVANEFCQLDALEDTYSVRRAVELMTKAVKMGKKFYLGLGFHKPHLPWQYSPEDYEIHAYQNISLPKHRMPPVHMPDIAFHMSDGDAHPNPWVPISDDDTITARRNYLAAVTGMDRKLGVFLKAIEDLGIENETAVILHGDHGWHLGEHGLWRKMTNFELATRVPFIAKIPWLETVERSADFVELVDLLPTIAELAGVPLPSNETFDGVSFVSAIDKSTSSTASKKQAAFSQYPRYVKPGEPQWGDNGIIHSDRSKFTHMGMTIRTHEWRYTEWVAWNKSALKPIWTNVTARELYDWRPITRAYPTDFDEGENENVVSCAENVAIVEKLSKMLRQQFDI